MTGCCEHDHGAPPATEDHAYRRVLWIALVLNAAMFVVEIAAGLASGSASLKADAVDFLGDAANYGVSLFVLGAAAGWSSRAALLKGISMAAFGLYVLGDAAVKMFTGIVPEPLTMGIVGTAALAVNVGVAVLLYRHRDGDANRRSVWLCTRNDTISNIAVLLAASGVVASGTGWPDFAVAAVMAGLALTSARSIIFHALDELRRPATAPAD